jgi:hypothetical protein
MGLFAVALAMVACATQSSMDTPRDLPPCSELTKTTGSHMLKRQECMEVSESDRDEAQRAARDVIDDQVRNTMPRIKP